MTSPRYLIVDINGDVQGTNDRDALPDIETSEDVCTIIDTLENTYSNEDQLDVDVADFEPAVDEEEEEE